MQSFRVPRHTTNPYIVMLHRAVEARPEVTQRTFSWSGALRADYDVFHVHWADTLLAGRSRLSRSAKRVGLILLLARWRVRGVAVVRTVHNARPRGLGRVDRALVEAVERRAGFRIAISPALAPGREAAVATIPHGHYRSWYARHARQEAVPGRLSFVGLIKPYKGVDQLIEVFARVRESDPSLTLTVAGRPVDDALRTNLLARNSNTPGLQLRLDFLADDELVSALTAGSLVVLPYREMHNSGVALAALSLDRPVLVPRTEINQALAEEVGPGWVHLYDAPLDDVQLRRTLQEVAAGMPSVPPDLSGREWDDAGAEHARVYLAAASGGGEARARRRGRRRHPHVPSR